jgi:hypothetical protein
MLLGDHGNYGLPQASVQIVRLNDERRAAFASAKV